MMPSCDYKRCRKVADESIGEMRHPGSVDGYGKEWTQSTWLCHKHAAKIRKLLNILELSDD
jgi:hypothetical protein